MKKVTKDPDGSHSDDADVKNGIPKDRGWAWFILLGATVDMLLVIGIVKCSGILFVAFQERFDSSSSMTSLLSTVQNICQSLTCFLAMTFGVRITTCRNMLFFGSIICCAAYVITSQATDIRLLLFSHGVLQGTGMGFMLPTAQSMINLYFEKRRGLANSIAVSGGSIGGLIFAPMLTKLFAAYGYQGCLLIVAGIMLNGCVIATLLRPTTFYTDRIHQAKTPQQAKGEKANLLSPNEKLSTLDKQSNVETLNKTVPDHLNWQVATGGPDKRSYSANDISHERERQNDKHGYLQNNVTHSLFPDSPNRRVFKSMEIFVEPRRVTSDEKVSLTINNDSSHENNSEALAAFKTENQLVVIEKKPERLSKKDKFKLLKNPIFWILLLQGGLIASGTLVAPIFIAPYAKDIGVSSDGVATLVTALSCVDLFARILIGYISDKGWLRSSSIVAISTLVISISTSLLRFYTSYMILLGYAVVLGLVSGAYFSLYAVVLIDYLTLENFQTSLGTLAVVHGFCTAGIFYLVGYLRDTAGSYIVPHSVIGVTTGVGAMILFLLPIIERFT